MVAAIAPVTPRPHPHALPASDQRSVVRYEPFGEARRLFECRDPEVLIEGPAGTGKSYAVLWKIHLACLKYPGCRWLMLRKTAVSLTTSVLVTYQERVLGAGNFGVRFYGGSRSKPAAFIYPNGSTIVIGGLDKATKVMSSEYDGAFINEAIEVTEDDLESVTSRLRYGVMPYQQLIADTNPGAPTHWLNQRCESGLTTRLRSRHEDNPTLWDRMRQRWTKRGADYIAKLDRLTGVRKSRLRFGQWVAAEGQVLDAWDPAIHLVRRDEIAAWLANAWYVGAVDWGWTKPGTLQVWAVDGDRRMALVAEHYHTRRAVESWWIPRAKALQAQYGVTAWQCDPSEPAYIELFRGEGLNAQPAANAILPGLIAMQDRLAVQPDGRPRLVVVEDCLLERDEELASDDRKPPISFVQEIPHYVWAKNVRGVLLDRPVDDNNHGIDTGRYAVAHVDLGPDGSFEALDTDLSQQLSDWRGI